MDNRINNGGNSTKSIKPDDKRKRSVRLKIEEDLEAMSGDWKKAIHQQIKKGNMAALKLWADYVLGRPTESLQIDNKTQETKSEKLERLNKLIESKIGRNS